MSFKYHLKTIVAFFTLTVIGNVSYAQNSVLESDSLALVEFYNALDGPNWSTNNWFEPGLTVSEWDNITVENNKGCFTFYKQS